MPRQACSILPPFIALAAVFLSLVQAAAFVCPPPALPHLNLRPSPSTRLLPTAIMASSTHNQADQQQQQHVLATLHPNRVLELQMNRPKALNALSSQMLLDLTMHVQRVLANEKDDEGKELIEAVLLTAVESSRAFSAGGDIKEIMAKLLSEKTETVTQGCNPIEYITIEYQLDSLLHKLSTLKPVLAICDGIVMGGGAGIFQGAGLRVVTPTSTFAMPECRIALLPDAGAMGFLFRAPGEVPLYCALTGARLGGECMKAVGLATHVVEGGDVPELLRVVRTQAVGERWREVLAGFEEKRKTGKVAANVVTPIEARRPLIDAIFKHDTVREIHAALLQEQRRQKEERATSSSVVEPGEKATTENEEEEGGQWIDTALAALDSECPVSHVVTLHAIRTAQRRGLHTWDIDHGLGIEHVANKCLGFRPDFVQGVGTAVGARKGETPVWVHASWEDAAEDPEIVHLLERMTNAKSVWEEIKMT